jgi:hypothetical protein
LNVKSPKDSDADLKDLLKDMNKKGGKEKQTSPPPPTKKK